MPTYSHGVTVTMSTSKRSVLFVEAPNSPLFTGVNMHTYSHGVTMTMSTSKRSVLFVEAPNSPLFTGVLQQFTTIFYALLRIFLSLTYSSITAGTRTFLIPSYLYIRDRKLGTWNFGNLELRTVSRGNNSVQVQEHAC